jgi:hypothetical protein
MTDQRQGDASLSDTAHEWDDGIVAASAARILARADRAVDEIRAEAERAAEEVRAAGEPAGVPVEPECAAADLRIEVEAERRDDRAAMAELSSDLESVHSQLEPINASIIGLQSHGLRQTGVAALVLAVLIAIAWKVIAG